MSLPYGPRREKPAFVVSDKARLKPVSSAIETSWKIEILLVASLDMILSNKRITKELIRLHGCAGWSAPVLFPNHRRQVISRRGPFIGLSFQEKNLSYANIKNPDKTLLVTFHI